MPIFVCDILADGRTETAPDMAPNGPGAWRWFHFDLSDPDLAPWAQANLPEIPAEALLHAETRPRCDAFDGGLILNLRAVNPDPGHQAEMMVSVRMWVTETLVVTVRKVRVHALQDIAQTCREGRAPRDVGDFLAELVRRLARRAHDKVLEIDAITEELELRFEETDAMPEISELRQPRRQVIRMLRYTIPQAEALERLQDVETGVLDDAHRIRLREPVNLMALSNEVLVSLKARLEALHEATHADVTAQLARNNYVLSLVAAVFLPLGFLAGLFGVNVGGMPGVQSPLAFALLCAGMAGLGVVSIAVLKWLRLL
ncbi:MAG: zinc transporter ZntB [Rhodobacteraceae bacterium]|nr:zinc transporter ZntB [Paracoccaceae bacterium]